MNFDGIKIFYAQKLFSNIYDNHVMFA